MRDFKLPRHFDFPIFGSFNSQDILFKSSKTFFFPCLFLQSSFISAIEKQNINIKRQLKTTTSLKY